MTREELSNKLIQSTYNNFLLELPTGMGKTKQALTLIEKNILPSQKILIVIPRVVLENNWKEEFIKWNKERWLKNTTFTTYVSLHKYNLSEYDCTIFDEAHHISDRCKEILEKSQSKYNIFLSATIKEDLKLWIITTFKNIDVIKVSTREAIDSDILPDPKIILFPLMLNYKDNTEELIKKNNKTSKVIHCPYKDRWKYMKTHTVYTYCTEFQYYKEISSEIEYYKRLSQRRAIFKNKWLRLCGERLKWLSNKKTDIILSLLKSLNNYRTLTFCNSIEQTEILGKYCINSKNKESKEILDLFNNKKIKHITACNILDEGVNLTSCRIGIYANLNSSERMITQKLGRLLRHKEPVIIIPYYKFTREEEIVKQMIEDYNPELITTVESINEIKI